MPISYQPAAPVGAFAALARQQNGSQGGVPLSEMYAMEMQAKQQASLQNASLMAQDRQFQDAHADQRAQFAASQNFSPRDQGIAQAQQAAQAQRFQHQIQLNQEELTQGENLRLQRLKQGADAIKQQIADGTVTEDEGKQMLGQLNTPIQVFEARKAASQIKHQDSQNELMQQQIQTQRAVEIRKAKDSEDHLAYSAAAIGKKLEYRIDEQQATPLRAKYSRDFPNLPPEEIEKAVKEELMGQGHFTTWFPDSKGVPTLAKDHPHGTQAAGSAGEGGATGTGTGKGGKGGVPEFDPSRAYHDAEAAVDKMLTAGTINKDDAQAEIQKRYEARKAAHGGYVGEKQAVATAGHPAPFNPNDLSTGSDAQKAQVVKLKDQFAMLPQLGLDPVVSQKVSHDINTAIKLVGQYADKDGRMDGERVPPIVKRELERINKRLSTLAPPPTAGVPSGPMTMEQRQALAQKLQDRASGAQQAGPDAGPQKPGSVWIPPHEVSEPGTGKRVQIPGGFVPEAAVPQVGETTGERRRRYLSQGLDRLRKSVTGEGPSISMGDY